MASILFSIYIDRVLRDQLLVTRDKLVYINKDVEIFSYGKGETGDHSELESKSYISDRNTSSRNATAFGDSKISRENDSFPNISNLEISSHPEGHVSLSSKNNNKPAHIKLRMDAYLCSLFIQVLASSVCYRSIVINHFRSLDESGRLFSDNLRVVVKLRTPDRDIIDYLWNERLERILLIHRESDNALSWLSTFGGAFSALGDYMERCAVMAGHISIHQLKIALKLGDPLVEARCKLWLALSMIQRGYLRRAKRLIRQQYDWGRSLLVIDTRLIRMCHGIWAKLQYAHKLQYQARKRRLRCQ